MNDTDIALLGLVEEVCVDFLQMDFDSDPGREVAQDHEEHDLVTASIHLTGAWSGTVLVQCSPALARQVASQMFETDAEELGDTDVEDAMGELANVIGGGYKSIRGGGSSLSLPIVTTGHFRVSVPGSEIVSRVVLNRGDEDLITLVVQRQVGKPAVRSA